MGKGIYQHKLNQGFQKGHKIYYLGDKNFNKNGGIWLGRKHTEASKIKMSETQKRIGNKPPSRKGEKMPISAKIKISQALKGEKAPNWQGGISFNPYPEEWKEDIKEVIRKRDNYICQICGIHQNELEGFNRKLDVHHKDYDKDNLNPENLITLCRSCHVKTNYNRNYWINYFL